MSRKDIIITDDNYDEEFEKICDARGCLYGIANEFFTELPAGFEKQSKEKEDDEDYCKVKIEPNIATDCSSAIENYELAYEFKNGFIIISERDSLFD